MNRHQRRASEKQNRKEATVKPMGNSPSTEQKIESLVSDMGKLLKYTQNLEAKFNLLMDVLTVKKICNWKDLADTENLYRQKELIKQIRIKQLLQENHSTREYLELIKEDSSLPGFQRLGIDPVNDLNMNPYELAQIIKDDNPSISIEEQIALGYKLYRLTKIHFGLA